MFKNAIVRKPCPEMIHGLTTASMGYPDYQVALNQHSMYIEAMQSCGLNVHVLDPDSTFVKDVALCTSVSAILTNPGAPSRSDEPLAMKTVLHSYYDTIDVIEAPGTLDAGYVMMTGRHFQRPEKKLNKPAIKPSPLKFPNFKNWTGD